MSDQHLHTNRLIREKSPYLLQHAHNPVDWYPWGDEAFQAAIKRDCPIFLSIGYATCHWCHVMEKESFENSDIAKLLNETFVCIKVDREELPEVDSLYMEFAQSMMSGAAGWPLNIILTPDLHPFFAVTYMPPTSKHQMTGLKELIGKIDKIWASEEREKILSQAEKIVEAFAQDVHTQGELLPPKETVSEGLEILYKIADPIYGGMRGAPKFPIAYQSNLMLRASKILKDSRALFLAERTLDMMERGGIFDHLGGGFSRYSVDEKWLVPHFEKMLYDNALLVRAYLDAWQLTKRPLYRHVCEETLNYILRDLKHLEGGFFSAEDADSEGKEGYFYTWTYEEVQKLLGDESELFCRFYDVTPGGNFEGRNILHTPLRLEEFIAKKGGDPNKLSELLMRGREILFNQRVERPRPFKDDKILTSWNGLAITALAESSAAFNLPHYLDAAISAARFLRTHLWDGEQLFHRWRAGETLYSATLEDYAFLVQGLLSLYEASGQIEWLEWAFKLNQILEERFKEEHGAYYQTDGSDPHLVIRKTHFSDGAEPSGNAIQCENLLRFYQFTADERYREQAEDVLRAAKVFIDNYAPGYCYHLMNINRYYDRHAPTLIIALNEKREHEAEIKQLIFDLFLPNKALIWLPSKNQAIKHLLPVWKDYHPIEEETTLYLCEEGRCLKPMTGLDEMSQVLQNR